MNEAGIACKTSKIFPAAYFRRYNEDDDSRFYPFNEPDEYLYNDSLNTFQTLTDDLLPRQAAVLDLTAGAHSYLSPEIKPLSLAGIGLSKEQMSRNPQLSEIIVQDLNLNPKLNFAEKEFDAALCTCGIQYLIQPLEIFCEINRILKPGGLFFVSFTGDCFPEKAIAFWLETQSRQHLLLVRRYFEASGNWRNIKQFPKLRSPQSINNRGLKAVWAIRDQDVS